MKPISLFKAQKGYQLVLVNGVLFKVTMAFMEVGYDINVNRFSMTCLCTVLRKGAPHRRQR